MKKIISGVLSVAISIVCIVPISAASSLEKNWKTPTEFNGAEKYGNISEKETIIINGELQPLLVTYDNRDSALENFKNVSNNKKYLSTLKEKYSLENLDNNNYEEYSSIVNQELLGDDTTYITEANELNAVLSIYADDDLNVTTKQLYEQYQANQNSMDLNTLTTNLPIFAPIVDEIANPISENNNPNSRVMSSKVHEMNVYANNHARPGTRNTAQYQSLNADCANFVSQILAAGGVHRSQFWNGNKQGCTQSWAYANGLANYFGKRNSTKNFSNFINASWGPWNGDVIGYSASNNGVINHVAYVSGKRPGALLISQHSSDYIDWTTNGASGWTRLKATFYIIG